MSKYEKDYFVGGKKSNYKDYRTKKFDGLAKDLVETLEIKKGDVVIDFGCGTGGLVACLKSKGFKKVKGTDVSKWAVEWGRSNFGLDDDSLQYYNQHLLWGVKDYVFFLDVLEHLPDFELDMVLGFARNNLRKGLVVRVPVSLKDGQDYYLEVSRNDKTHIQIHDKSWWLNKFCEFGYSVCYELDCSSIFDSDGVFAAVFEVDSKWVKKK